MGLLSNYFEHRQKMKQIKQDGKSERAEDKYSYMSESVQNGIDPRKANAEAISSSIGSLSSAASSIFGKGSNPTGSVALGGGFGQITSNPIMLIAIILGAFLLFRRKK